MLRAVFRLLRPKHYLKNSLIFIPLVFSGQLLVGDTFWQLFAAAIVFSLAASIVYIFNDIRDKQKDKHHPKKKNRPLASGALTVSQAVNVMVALVIIVIVVGLLLQLSAMAWALLGTYVLINILYSLGLKNMPIIDVAILASGFVLRIFFGASVLGIEVSSWLYLTVLAGAFYFALGKRRNELLTTGTKHRAVNKFYSVAFLDKNMYVSQSLLLVFYSLWATNTGDRLEWTIPIVFLLFLAYSRSVEKEGSLGDPVDVFLGDKTLLVLIFAYIVLTAGLLYL